MKKTIKLSLIAAIATAGLTTQASADTEKLSLEMKIEKLAQETANLKKQVKKLDMRNKLDDIRKKSEAWSPVRAKMVTTYNAFKQTDATGKSFSDNGVMTTKLDLNLHAKATDNIEFFGKGVFYKYWGGAQNNPYSNMDSMQGLRPEADNDIDLTRAYIKIHTLQDSIIPVTYDLGRIAAGEGPSSFEYQDDKVRKSKWIRGAFDGAADGASANLDLSKLVKQDLSAVVAVGKAFTDTTAQNGDFNGYDGSNALKDTMVTAVAVDGAIPYLSNSFFQILYAQMDDLVGYNEGGPQNANLGDLNILGLGLEANQILDSKFSAFVQYTKNTFNPNGNTVLAADGVTNISLAGGGSPLTTQNGGSTQEQSGNMIWLGVSYKTDFGLTAGYEYNKGSKYHYTPTCGSVDLVNKLNARGDAQELWFRYHVPNYKGLTLKASHTQIDYNYTGSGWHVGTPMEIATLGAMGAGIVDKLNYTTLAVEYNF